MPIILRLITAGVPAAKIIAKYGKKAYKKATKWIQDNPDKSFKAWAIGALGTTGLTAIGTTIAGKYNKKKEKKLEKKTGGTIKIYAKGSIVRKPKY